MFFNGSGPNLSHIQSQNPQIIPHGPYGAQYYGGVRPTTGNTFVLHQQLRNWPQIGGGAGHITNRDAVAYSVPQNPLQFDNPGRDSKSQTLLSLSVILRLPNIRPPRMVSMVEQCYHTLTPPTRASGPTCPRLPFNPILTTRPIIIITRCPYRP